MTPLKIVQSFYKALGRGDVTVALGLLDDGVQWTEAIGFPYYSGTWTGPQAVLENLLVPLSRDWDWFSATPQSYAVDGSIVVAFGTYTGVYKATKKSLAAPFVHRWNVANGKAVSFSQYSDTVLFREALASGE